MALLPFAKSADAHALLVGMTGVKMGERFIQIGCEHGGRLGAVAVKVGLSGRAVAVVPDDASAARARKGAEQAGVLVDVEVAPLTALPVDDHAFDVAVVDDTAGLVDTIAVDRRGDLVRELLRVLRPGGRVIAIGGTPRAGLGALFSRASASGETTAAALHQWLTGNGFRSARTLAERDGLVFVEAIKSR
jgi:ubiquinone/menaquinone biosynthesis C-methylase UbiE